MPEALFGRDKLYYEVHGEGAPVIFISGLGSDHTLWHWQVEEYSKEYKCIFFDNRGIGDSSISEDLLTEENLTMQLLASDVAGLMEKLEIERSHIVGASLGGVIAQYFAVMYPEKLITLSLHSSWGKSSALINLHFKTQMALLEKITIGELLISMAPTVWSEDTLVNRLDLLIEFRNLKKDSKAPVSQELYTLQVKACLDFNLLDKLSRIKVPVLVTAGADDILIHPRNSKLIHRSIPESEYIEFTGCGHASLVEKHREFNMRTLEFLKKYREIK